jgi:hypothetical protein
MRLYPPAPNILSFLTTNKKKARLDKNVLPHILIYAQLGRIYTGGHAYIPGLNVRIKRLSRPPPGVPNDFKPVPGQSSRL